jgi:hypothetical protein
MMTGLTLYFVPVLWLGTSPPDKILYRPSQGILPGVANLFHLGRANTCLATDCQFCSLGRDVGCSGVGISLLKEGKMIGQTGCETRYEWWVGGCGFGRKSKLGPFLVTTP